MAGTRLRLRLVVPLVALASAIGGPLVRLVAGAAAILPAALLAVLAAAMLAAAMLAAAVLALLAGRFGFAGPVGTALLVLLVHWDSFR